MRAVITRVNEASVTIGGQETARIGKGFLVLLGVHVSDTEAEADRIVDRICGLRVFEDEAGKMNVNPTDAGAELLIVSQFTLFADCRSRRPGFTAAARPETAVPLAMADYRTQQLDLLADGVRSALDMDAVYAAMGLHNPRGGKK